jgi:acetaldehyde dehydrogenase (acetylating)
VATTAPAHTDRDLASISEARHLARKAKEAQLVVAEFSQTQVDGIVDAMAAAVTAHAESLARLAVEETTFGVVADKVQKNLFGSKDVYEFIRPMKTVGVINRIPDKKIIEIAEPFGVVAAIVPSTNPTSTAIYKILISIKARCAIVISPHPSAARCITRTAEIMADAARRAGLPDGGIGWLTTVTLEGTQELMKQREIAVILATGGMGLVRAAYSAGKPAYGVGPGNAPCYIEQSADLAKAADDIITGKAFDNGVLCSSPNSVVVDRSVEPEVRREFLTRGGYFLSAAESDVLAKALVTPQRLPNPGLVGKSAMVIAEKVGLKVPNGTRALIAELKGVGRDYPLSIEKLCPVLSYYIVQDWREGCERCKEILRYGGMGHTMSIHSRNEQVILEFGLHKPAFRIVVNTPTTHGSIGLSTGLDPAMTLGCGGFGGNITSDNISPRHLLNIKRVAYETRPVTRAGTLSAGGALGAGGASALGALGAAGASGAPASLSLPQAPAKPLPEPIAAEALTRRIDAFLASRGIGGALSAPTPRQALSALTAPQAPVAPAPPAHEAPSAPEAPSAFVCEDDVRSAVKAGTKIVIGEKTIVTPAARDAGEAAKVFTWQSYRS